MLKETQGTSKQRLKLAKAKEISEERRTVEQDWFGKDSMLHKRLDEMIKNAAK